MDELSCPRRRTIGAAYKERFQPHHYLKSIATNSDVDDLQSEYKFDYSKARPNRFAERITEDNVVMVALDPDVAQVFTSAEAVNAILRALIQNMPK